MSSERDGVSRSEELPSIEEVAYSAVQEVNHQAHRDIQSAYGDVLSGLRSGELDPVTVDEYRAALRNGVYVLEEMVEPLVEGERSGRER